MNLAGDDLVALFYMQKYTFLTIGQAVKVIDRGRSYQGMGRRLREIAEDGLIGGFGGHRIGFVNVPKVYFLKRRGYEVLRDNGFSDELLGRFKEKSEPTWSPQTNHRLHLIDLFLALEIGIRQIERLELERVFLEYNRVKQKETLVSETADFVVTKKAGMTEIELERQRTPENKIIPDGAFILRSKTTGAQILYMVEMDMGTERIISRVTKQTTSPLYERMKKYDRYLMSLSYADKYRQYGKFDHFVVLFITVSVERMESLRKKLFDLPDELHQYYLFSSYDDIMNNFFHKQWKARAINDNHNYCILG